MATPQDIIGASGLARMVSNSLSISPTATFHSPPSSFGGSLSRATAQVNAKQLKPFDTQDIKILLLENVNQSGKDILSGQGYQVEALKTSLPEDELIEKIRYGTSKQLKFNLANDSCIEMSMLLELDQRLSSVRKSSVKRRI